MKTKIIKRNTLPTGVKTIILKNSSGLQAVRVVDVPKKKYKL